MITNHMKIFISDEKKIKLLDQISYRRILNRTPLCVKKL